MNNIPTHPINLEHSKLPPQAIDLEEAVLGAIMLEERAFNLISDIIHPESFYKDNNQKIFQAIKNLNSKNKAIDLLTVPEELRSMNLLDEVGGIAYISQLTSRVATAAHIEDHAEIINIKYKARELIRISSEIQNRAFDESIDIEELIDFSENEIFEVSKLNTIQIFRAIEVLSERVKTYEHIQKSGKQFNGIPCGYGPIDKITLGWQNQDLIIIAARPSVGKTQMMLHFAFNSAIQGYKLLIFTLEMSKEQLIDRLLGIASKINPMKAKKGSLSVDDWDLIEQWVKKFVEVNIFIIDKPGISINEVKSISRRVKMDKNIDAVYIDYMQLMQGERSKNSNREQEISSISRGLKGLAKSVNVPVIALSQLNRDADNQKPSLKHLRESGAIEQDADLVMFIHREKTDTGRMAKEGDFILAKHRNGIIGDYPFSVDNDAMTTLIDSEPF